MFDSKRLWKTLTTSLGLIALLSLSACGDKESQTEETADTALEQTSDATMDETTADETLAEVEEVLDNVTDEISEEDYLAAQAAYLEANATKEGVVVTESGLQYRVIESAGREERASPDDWVQVHYKGTFIDGEEFDSSYGGTPAMFQLNRVIRGWTEGLQLMGIGDKFEFTIPAELGYGPEGYPGAIPGGATLIFEIELLDIPTAMTK